MGQVDCRRVTVLHVTIQFVIPLHHRPPLDTTRRCHELNFLSCTINLCRPIRIICSIHKQVSRLIYFLLFDAIHSRGVFKLCKNPVISRLYYIMIRSSFLLLHNSNSQSNNKA